MFGPHCFNPGASDSGTVFTPWGQDPQSVGNTQAQKWGSRSQTRPRPAVLKTSRASDLTARRHSLPWAPRPSAGPELGSGLEEAGESTHQGTTGSE